MMFGFTRICLLEYFLPFQFATNPPLQNFIHAAKTAQAHIVLIQAAVANTWRTGSGQQ
jgi:hypothetical protein